MKNLKEYIVSVKSRRPIYGIGALLIALLIFHTGVAIGSHRHHRERRGWHGFITEGHGAVGIIQEVASSSLRMQMRDDSPQTVWLTSTTIIRGDDASSTTLVAGQQIVVLGTPRGDGTLSADLIHIRERSDRFIQRQ